MTLVRHSLAAQFFAAFAITAALVIAFLGAMFAYTTSEGFSKYLLQGELSQVEELVDALSAAHDPRNPGWPELAEPGPNWPEFVKDNLDLRPPEPPRPPRRPPPRGFDPMLIEMRIFLLGPDGEEIIPPRARAPISDRRPIPAPGASAEDPPIGYIGLTAPRGGRTPMDLFYLKTQYLNLASASLVALLLSATAAALLARYQLRPIKALEQGARALAGGAFETRIPNTRRDELGQLIDHTNALAESLQAARDAERQWISDTTHELQTPLAVLRAEIEAIQDGIRKADMATLDEMHASVMRLSRLVADLKALSFSREGKAEISARETDFSDLLGHRLDLAEARYSEAGLALSRNIEAGLTLCCDAGRIAQVIDNLLENALRYTSAPGELRVSAHSIGDEILVGFADTPPAPPAEAMPKLFDRFFRAEASRARHLGGSGLGLAICNDIVKTHGGTISAGPSPLGGLRIEVVLPKQGPQGDKR